MNQISLTLIDNKSKSKKMKQKGLNQSKRRGNSNARYKQRIYLKTLERLSLPISRTTQNKSLLFYKIKVLIIMIFWLYSCKRDQTSTQSWALESFGLTISYMQNKWEKYQCIFWESIASNTSLVPGSRISMVTLNIESDLSKL